ncbi:hypothetical protein ACSNOI_40195 [Actinomadura kijaniata]|uniref:hypothetical protein n=1 Tax=Actinomadura kijaniata TaxID=46161 RepID=UPI003F1E0D21
MSFDLAVHGTPRGPGQQETELYEHPLGAHGTVMRHWVEPAGRLGLPLLARLSDGELTVGHHELAAFAEELNALARDWQTSVPGDGTIPVVAGRRHYETPLLDHLLTRLNILRMALRMAEVTDGHLYLSG